MKAKFYKSLIFIVPAFLIMILASGEVRAQSKVGTTMGQFLRIEPSARGAAFGNASTALSGEASAAFYNPASLGLLSGLSVQFTHSQWLADIDFNYAIVALPIPQLGIFSLQVTSLNSGEIDVRTVEQPLGTGERYSVNNFALGLGYGLRLTNRVSIGVLLNYLQESIWHSTAAGVAFNMGVQYQLSLDGPILGASVSNFGPRMSFDGRDLFIDYDFDPEKFGDNSQLPAQLRTDAFRLPTIYRVGMSFPVRFNENNQLLLAVDATHPNDNFESVNIGGEFTVLNLLSLRGGYQDLFLNNIEGGLVLGAGLKVAVSTYQIVFDYAWADYGRLNETHRITLGLAL